MRKSMVWKLVAMAFVLNAVGLLWIRNEMVEGIRESVSSSQEVGLRVVALEPKKRAERADRLLVVFNQDLVEDKQIGQAIGWSPFLIDPSVQGNWRWSRKDAMEFKLVEPFLKGNLFTMKTTDRFAMNLGQPLSGKKEFSFRSSPLLVERCVESGRKGDRVEVELRFNQEVEPIVLAEYFEVVDANGKLLDKEVLSSGRRRVHVVMVELLDERIFEISLKKGMAGVEGPLGLEKDFIAQITVAPTFGELSARVPWRRGTDEKCSVELRFNQRLDTFQEKPVVSLVPHVDNLVVSLTQQGIRLYGTFEGRDRHFVATVQSDVRSFDGEVLPAGVKFPFVLPKRYPEVSFVRNQGVLSPKGNLEIDLKTASIESLRLSATKIYPNNLGAHLRGVSSYNPQRIGKELFSTVKPIRQGANSVCLSVINLKDWIEKPLGLYSIKAENEESSWHNDRAVVAVTNLMVTTKVHPQGVLTWITSLAEGKPLKGVGVTVLSTKNQTLAKGITNTDGLVSLIAPEDHPAGAPWVVLAEQGDDLSFRRLDQRKWDLPKVAKDGREPVVGLGGYLYAARGVRRPGELVRLTGIVRNEKGESPDTKTPLELRVSRPDGKIAKTVSIRLDEGGVFHYDFQTPLKAWTGTWGFSLYLPGTDREIATVRTGVEAFVPVRLEVESKPVKSWFGLADSPAIEISSRYLFGVAASGSAFKVSGEWKPAPFEAIGLDDFSFGDPSSTQKIAFNSIQSETDENGEAIVFPSTDRLTPGCWKGSGYVSVTVPGGGTVSDSFELRKFQATRMIGVRIAKGETVLTDDPFIVELTAVQPLAEQVPVGAVEVVLEKIESDWVHQRVNGTWTWSKREDAVERSKLLVEKVSDSEQLSRVELTCDQPGSWQILTRDLVGGAITRVRFQVSSPGTPAAVVRSPHRVDLAIEKSSYRPGEIAKVFVDSPFSGQLLLTLETDRVVWSKSVSISDQREELDVPLPARMPGGAFVTASVIRPLDTNSLEWKPYRAYGIVRVATDFTDREIELDLQLPSEARPGSEVEVQVRSSLSGENSFLHLWAVDEGVLSVTEFETPSPINIFFAPWRAKVDSGDLYLELFEDYKRSSSMERFGAGGGASRRALVQAKPTKSVILWNEFVPVGENGLSKAKFSLPADFTGELRFMAVVVKGNSFGSAESSISVTSPLLAELSLPRFVAPGDKFLSPVTLFNSTKEDMVVETFFELAGPVRLLDDSKRAVAVEAGSSITTWFELQAEAEMGQVLVSVLASAMGEKAFTKGAFPVRPAATLDAEYATFILNAGAKLAIPVPARFLSNGLNRTLTISSSPVTELVPALDELLSFPYGCAEQTTSKAMPMLYASALLDSGKAEFAKESVRAGIRRLELMQTTSGGLAYWPGGKDPYLWATCYASSFLMEAKRAGFELEEDFLAGLTSYLRKTLRADKHDMNEQAFVCQVLATFGKPEKSRQRYLLDKVDILDLSGRARLAGAWLASGRPDLARQCLREGTLSQKVDRTYDGRLTSDVSACSTMLSVLLDLEVRHPWVEVLKKRILLARRDGRWPSTLDNGMALASLCKLHSVLASDPSEFSGTVSTPESKGTPFSSDRTTDHSFSGMEEIEITSSGTGKIFVSIKTEGLVSPEDLQPTDQGIKARRRWLNSKGEVIKDWTSEASETLELTVGDLVWVEVMLQSKGPDLENIALVDALPGGFAVENPRLATSAIKGPGRAIGLKPSSRADRTEFLDDRIVLFASAKSSSQTFRYALRAVSSGEFLAPPIQASCMYDETQHSLGESGLVKVYLR
jgi:alpha-2-macroglobulin